MKNILLGPCDAHVPSDLNLCGRVQAVDFMVADRLARKRYIMLSPPQVASAVEAATGDLLMTLCITIGLYAQEFGDGGGI